MNFWLWIWEFLLTKRCTSLRLNNSVKLPWTCDNRLLVCSIQRLIKLFGFSSELSIRDILLRRSHSTSLFNKVLIFWSMDFLRISSCTCWMEFLCTCIDCSFATASLIYGMLGKEMKYLTITLHSSYKALELLFSRISMRHCSISFFSPVPMKFHVFTIPYGNSSLLVQIEQIV